MAKIIITILAAIVIIDAVIAYACCAVAGRADDVAELERVRADLDAEKAERLRRVTGKTLRDMGNYMGGGGKQ